MFDNCCQKISPKVDSHKCLLCLHTTAVPSAPLCIGCKSKDIRGLVHLPLNASVQWLGEEGAAQAQFPGVCRSKWLLPCKPQPHTSSGIDQALSFHAECYHGIAYCHAGEHDKCNKIKATAAGAGEPSSTTTSSTGSSSSKKTSTKRRKKPITKCHGRRQQLESAGWQLAAATPPDGWTKDHTATPMQQRARYEQVVANRKYSQQYPSHKLCHNHSLQANQVQRLHTTSRGQAIVFPTIRQSTSQFTTTRAARGLLQK